MTTTTVPKADLEAIRKRLEDLEKQVDDGAKANAVLKAKNKQLAEQVARFPAPQKEPPAYRTFVGQVGEYDARGDRRPAEVSNIRDDRTEYEVAKEIGERSTSGGHSFGGDGLRRNPDGSVWTPVPEEQPPQPQRSYAHQQQVDLADRLFMLRRQEQSNEE